MPHESLRSLSTAHQKRGTERGTLFVALRRGSLDDRTCNRARRYVMTPDTLRRHVVKLREMQPITEHFERSLTSLSPPSRPSRYRSQKQHWLCWLGEYDSPGFYGRQNWNRSAAFVYNHLICAPMVLWLTEAPKVPNEVVRAAASEALRAPPRAGSQCAAIRGVIPWTDLERRLNQL